MKLKVHKSHIDKRILQNIQILLTLYVTMGMTYVFYSKSE